MLLVDIGNSRLKWALLKQGKCGPSQVVVHQGKELAGVLERLFGTMKAPQRIIIASVAGPALAEQVASWMKERWQVAPELALAQASAGGIRNAYAEPGRLGVDRWAGLLAARQRVKGAVGLVDCGTAITIDILAASGEHLGGLIIPGISMMRESLVRGTKGIQIQKNTASEVSLLARDTEGAVWGGTLYAAVAVIDRVISDVSAALGEELTCLITGGDAPILLPLLQHRYLHEPDLVLHGLQIIATEGS